MICVLVFWGSILSAAWSDARTTYVRDILFAPGIICCIGILISKQEWSALPGILIVAVLQIFLFSRMYGGADCLAFVLCAAYIAVRGGSLKDDLLVMLYSVTVLALVQAFRKNINRKGNLKQPVAFIPYIVAGMVVWTVTEEVLRW